MPGIGYAYKGERVDCPVCDSPDHETICRMDRRLKRLDTSLCGHCGLFFTNPMPTDAELDLYYRYQYRLDYQFALFRPRSRHMAKKNAEAVRRAEVLTPHIGDRAVRFLDFGCGSGELVRHMGASGHEAVGLEPGETYSKHGAEALKSDVIGPHARIDHGAWQAVDYGAGAFDVISALHVVEHLRDPLGALRAMHHWLAEDGILYLEVPNLQGYRLKGFENFHFAHVLGFSRDTLIYAASRAGFVVLESKSATSLLLRKRRPEDPAEPPDIDLAATVVRNRAEYGQPMKLKAYLSYHLARARYRLLQAG
jgi:2-polyprenyl-3-methyl-5-hydroxy-6-metoxy-1,4-benzoquinol methylase